MKRITIWMGLFLVISMGCSDGGDNADSNLDTGNNDNIGDDDDDNNNDNNDNNDDNNDNNDDNDDNNDDNNDNNDDTETGSDCGEWDLEIEVVPTRLMLLQDLSGSMNQGEPPKWQQAQAALTGLMETFGDKLEFGFDIFPNVDTERCKVQGDVIMDAFAQNGEAIIGLLDQMETTQSTPLYLGMQNFLNPNYAQNFLSTEVESYLVIVSDGGDSCGIDGNGTMGDGATAEQLGEMAAKLYNEAGVMSIVIGFGDGVDPEQLDQIALNGGTPFETYFTAGNQAELETAFNEIAEFTVSCVFDVVPDVNDSVDFDQVNFYFDGDVVPMDPDCAAGIGWSWVDNTQTQVAFCDAACDKLKTGTVTEISATFGCDTIIVD